MIHLIWYIVVGLIAGIIAKSVMHVHMTIFWTIVLGIIGSIIGGAVTHMFSHPTTGRFHPAGLLLQAEYPFSPRSLIGKEENCSRGRPWHAGASRLAVALRERLVGVGG